MPKSLKVLLIVGGVFIAVLLVAIIGIALVAESLGRGNVPENSVLVMRIGGTLPDHAPRDPMAKVFGISQPASLTDTITNLRKAKADSRIGAVLLDIEFTGFGWGKADELRRAIKDLRDSGKPVYAYTELGMNKEYYVASAAEKIFMPPTGDIYVNGFAANAMFYRGSLDKLGIEPEVIQIGKYKNAPDQYTRTDMSEGQREVINAILDDLYGRLVSSIAKDRKLEEDTVKELIDGAPYRATKAKSLGLIDGAKYRDEVYEELRKKLGYKEDDKLRTVTASVYSEVSPASLDLNNGSRVAVIYASGAITTGRSSSSPFGGSMVGSDTIVGAVKQATDDESIKAIVLRVDSPGGSALASDLMWHALEKAKAKKPVVVSMADYAASGGYYISCNANKIVAEPSVLTGSIGVFMGKPNLSGFYDWLGVTNEYVLRGKNAGLFRETENWTEEERAKFQEQANNIYYTDFVPKVAKGRKMNDEAVNSIGQGRVWTGAQAKERGLVDEFGGLEKAIEIAKSLSKIPADEQVTRVALPKAPTLFETIFGSGVAVESKEVKARKAIVESLPRNVRKTLQYAELYERMGRGESMLMMPFEIEIK
ncbi:MAG: signal peptide peptidase SppA [Pyrinomonadaceae bacterium]|nr:signal peptide peptidase SppA [Pyrinomonadaceae bacterium]